MKTFLPYISVLLFSLVLAVSCGSRKSAEPVIVERTKTITQKVHDTIFKVEKDSAYYEAYVECINGQPVINQGTAVNKPGKDVAAAVQLKGNTLNVDCTKRAQELYHAWISNHTQQTDPVVVEVPVHVEVEREFTWWQKVQLWAGRIFLLFLLVGLATLVFKIIK